MKNSTPLEQAAIDLGLTWQEVFRLEDFALDTRDMRLHLIIDDARKHKDSVDRWKCVHSWMLKAERVGKHIMELIRDHLTEIEDPIIRELYRKGMINNVRCIEVEVNGETHGYPQCLKRCSILEK